MTGRITIDDITPVISHGAYPAKATTGEYLPIAATVWREGHEAVGATVTLTGPDGRPGPPVPMTPDPGDPDRFSAVVVPGTPGPYTFHITAYADPWATWCAEITAHLQAGPRTGLDNELELGARLLERAAAHHSGPARSALLAAAAQLRTPTRPTGPEEQAKAARQVLAGPAPGLMAERPVMDLVTHSAAQPLTVERVRARFSSWYELFPRSTGGRDAEGRPVHGTMVTAAAELPRIAAMGFDVVYLPPIHPIGRIRRKGRNNALTAREGDVGSPWAVGSADGGHTALHPALGTLEDFDAFVAQAAALGIETALDLALQCAPDHPWLTTRRQWFTTRPDGTIAHAANPPKTYEDIHPLNFDTDPEGLAAEIEAIVRFWMARGIRAFRVDNPHTKPAAHWQRLIRAIHTTDPDVLFLAEAFTRPTVMKGLARCGFSQSYTYFTWCTTKQELTDYATELATTTADFLRPNIFPTTPDILPAHLHHAPAAMFALRATLAATLSPSWGIISGYELGEATPLTPDGEDYLDSEKYQLTPRDFTTPTPHSAFLTSWITHLNTLRRTHSALQQLRTLRFHPLDNDHLIAYSKHDAATGDGVLCVVTLDPHQTQQGTLTLTRPLAGMWAVEEITGDKAQLTHRLDIKIDPAQAPARIYTWRNP
ncbi:maltotransferase domain-containing protein [Streptomyces purpureus]|uniref:maltotransferase domain-containing protein n=1 Tax=Streptomyces purpureus TaxID=1951 RepID=UPI0037AC1299